MQANHMTREMHERLWTLLSMDEYRRRKRVADSSTSISERTYHGSGLHGLGGGNSRDNDRLSLCELVVAVPPGFALPIDKVIKISVVEGPSKGLTCRVAKPHVTIGRLGGGADIEINDRYASGLHCAMGVKRDIIRLRDLDSRNGTYVENQRVSIVSLGHRSEFCVGVSVLLVTVLPARTVPPGEEVNEFAEGKEA